MAVCVECATAADINRSLFNQGKDPSTPHPDDCKCTCQHRPTVEWAARYIVKEPSATDS